MKLKPRALGLSLGIIWGGALFLTTWLCLLTGWISSSWAFWRDGSITGSPETVRQRTPEKIASINYLDFFILSIGR